MIENDEYAREYASQLVWSMTPIQRHAVFSYLESLFDAETIAGLKADTQTVVDIRADMGRRMAEMRKREGTLK